MTNKILYPDERLDRIVRKHWFIFLGQILGPIVLMPIPFLFFVLPFPEGFPLTFVRDVLRQIDLMLLFIVGTTWLLLLWMRLFAVWTDYYLDAWVLTDKRIINIDQIGFFKREIASLRLEKIQDIKVAVRGIIATLLDFGVIHVQTAGVQKEFVFPGIPQPYMIKERIGELRDGAVEKLVRNTDTRGGILAEAEEI